MTDTSLLKMDIQKKKNNFKVKVKYGYFDLNTNKWIKRKKYNMDMCCTRTKDVVKFKKLDPKAIIPKYQTKDSAGFDFASLTNYILEPGEVRFIQTGLAVQLEKGTEMQIRPRSGISIYCPNYIANSPGTIDADYRGEIKIVVVNNTKEHWHIVAGERIAQGVIKPVLQPDIIEVDDMLDKTERADRGFGSTGK